MEVISLYEMEVSPIDILNLMKNNIYDHEEQTIVLIDKTYTYHRKFLITLIHKISNKMGFKSQTFFLAVNYLDIIFIKFKDISYNYSLLAVGCLIIASKFCENVPLRPIFKYFVNLYNNEIKDNIITKDDLFKYEIIICKILNYKLNFYTIYDFNFFFFGNGIIKIEQLKEINYDISSINIDNYNSSSNVKSFSKIKKILIKIYEKSRHYLDIIIETLICLKYNSLLISIYIMEKSIDYVLLKEFNSKNGEKSIDIDKIQYNNREYFRQIMKDFYKINLESLPEYNNLKTECEKYKLFDDISNNRDSNNLNENINIINLNKINYYKNSSSKNISKINNISPKNKYLNNNEANEKIKFLYKKVNVPIFPQNDIKKYHKNYAKHSSKKRINSSRDNNLYFRENKNKINNSKILTTTDNFYQKDHINIRNSTSNHKNNYYLKKSNTSSSPFNKSPKNNLKNLCNKLNMINKIKIKKKLDGSDENIITNLNTIERKKKINKIVKPYIKKIIQNYDKNQEENIINNKVKDNKNININININNKILYDNSNNYKDKTLTTKKILISKYLNKNNFSFIRGKSLVHKPRTKNKNNINSKIIFGASPIFERKSSNSKKRCNIPKYQCLIINKNNINSICLEEIDNNNNDNLGDNNINNSNRNYNAYKIKTKYDLYNSNLTSRNSFQYKKHNSKLTDSFLNIKIPHLNNDSFDKKMSTSIVEYNYNDNNNKLYPLNNNNTLNEFKYKNTSLSQRNNDTNEFNNKNNQSSFIENNKNKLQKIIKEQVQINNSINNNDNNENEKKFTENSYKKNDIKAKNYSNLLDYSTGVSNEKNI